jgi:2-polyprenyl-3-methyl-5-hydroxy-6-metoxy-1,4-benzoquinol methylase
MQITSDFAKEPFSQLKIIDFGCGEGVYAIEAALHGAEVLASDARDERMKDGVRAAARSRAYEAAIRADGYSQRQRRLAWDGRCHFLSGYSLPSRF